MKGELKGSLYVPFKGVPKIFFQGVLKVAGLLDSALEGVLEGIPRDAINNLYQDAQEATITCECKQNFVNILSFQLLLSMFNLSKIQVINRGSTGSRERSQNYSIA